MWQETDMQKAVKAAAKGKEVRVAVPDGDDGYRLIPFERYFQDCRFLIGVPAVRNSEFEEAMHPLEHVPAAGEDKPVPGTTKRAKKIDTGKLLALHKAGWSQRKIAEELKVVPSTVCTYLKKMEDRSDEKD